MAPPTTATPPATRALSSALMRALGEYSAFASRAQRRSRSRKRRDAASAAATEEKRAITEWLRSLRAEEVASLCSVVDAGFVKTVLSMSMVASRQRKGVVSSTLHRRQRAIHHSGAGVVEFQLLPAKIASTKRKSADTGKAQALAPREFVARPSVRMADGDVFGAFHTREYEEQAEKLSAALRFLNTHKSCDTVSISLVALGVMAKQSSVDVDALLRVFGVLSYGGFLGESPSSATLVDRVWGETKWLSMQGYYSVEALIVNHIELNIWTHWKMFKASAQNDPLSQSRAKIALVGPGSKHYLVREWQHATAEDRQRIAGDLHSIVVEHLGQFVLTSSRLSYQAAKDKLERAITILSANWMNEQHLVEGNVSSFAEEYFGCPLSLVVTSPEVAALKLLVAEHLQEKCSALLSDRLARETAGEAGDGMTAVYESNGDALNEEATIKAPNHLQRRRASRKKKLKQQRQHSQMKSTHQRLLKVVLDDLCDQVRQRRAEELKIVSSLLDQVIDLSLRRTEHLNGNLGEGGNSAHGGALPKKKKTKKKKHKTKKAPKTVSATSSSANQHEREGYDLDGDTLSTELSHPAKENQPETSNDLDRDDADAPFDSKRDLNMHKGQGGFLYSTNEPRPYLGFLSGVNATAPQSSSLSLSHFGSRSLYSSTPNSLFSAQKNRSAFSVMNDHDGGESGSDNDTMANHSSFGWPSVFSRPALDRGDSLDWNFYNFRWPLKPDISDNGASVEHQQSQTEISALTHPEDDCEVEQAPSGRDRKNSIVSFPDIAPIRSDLERHSSLESDVVGSDTSDSNEADHRDEEMDSTSDFLYRKGGFFDRQRVLKRRRQPTPFKYNAAGSSKEASTGGTIQTVYEDEDEQESTCCQCCQCTCHLASTEDRDKQTDTAFRKELEDTRSELKKVLDRLSTLEKEVDDKISRVNDATSGALNETSTLQTTVSTLSIQLQTAESEIQQLQLYQASVVNYNCDEQPPAVEDTGVVGLDISRTSTASSPPPFSPSPSEEDHVSSGSPEVAAPPMEFTYSQSIVHHPATAGASVMGPFVSVPMSVLPPRSKLHWDMCEYVSQLQTECNARLPAQMEAQRLCTATVQSLWPRAQVRPYGSYVTRLVLPSSDLDLVICLPKVRRDTPADTAGVLEGRNAIKETWQQNLARKLRQEPWVVPDSVKTLPHASVPIITLLTAPPYNVRLDISFEGPGHNGLATNDVVLSLLHEFPALAPIMLVLKSFAIERGVAAAYSGGLSSYALLLLVARYLQEYHDTMPNGFEHVSAAVQHSISAQSAADFGMMLMGFLDFYGNRFDPRTTGISVASRCFLNRESMSSGTTARDQGHLHDPDESSGSTTPPMDERATPYSANHWQMTSQSPTQNPDLLSSPGSRRYSYRSSLDWPQHPAAAGTMMTMMMEYQQSHVDPHKFDPVFIEDPLRPSNNVGRNCFRIMQIRRALASAHQTLLMASQSSSVFIENRGALVAGVALHPDNLLRSILGPHAPVNAKTELTLPSVAIAEASGRSGLRTSLSGPLRQTPQSMQQNYMRFQQFAAVGVAATGVRSTTYQPQAVATPYFGSEYAYSGHDQPVPPPQNQHHQHHHQSYLDHHSPGYARSTDGVGGAAPYASSYRGSNDGSSRRYSESESERMTTRSVTSVDRYERSRRDRIVSSPRMSQPTAQRSSSSAGSTADDRSANHHSSGDLQTLATRKSPARSLSFADVVVGGGGGARRMPTSPLALARQGRFWRDDSAINDSISEKWETKDDSQLK